MILLKNKNHEYLGISASLALKFKNKLFGTLHAMNGTISYAYEQASGKKPETIKPLVDEAIGLISNLSKRYVTIVFDPTKLPDQGKTNKYIKEVALLHTLKNDLTILSKTEKIVSKIQEELTKLDNSLNEKQKDRQFNVRRMHLSHNYSEISTNIESYINSLKYFFKTKFESENTDNYLNATEGFLVYFKKANLNLTGYLCVNGYENKLVDKPSLATVFDTTQKAHAFIKKNAIDCLEGKDYLILPINIEIKWDEVSEQHFENFPDLKKAKEVAWGTKKIDELNQSLLIENKSFKDFLMSKNLMMECEQFLKEKELKKKPKML